MNLAALKDALWVENAKRESQQVAESDNQGPEVTEDEEWGRDMVAGVKRVQDMTGKNPTKHSSNMNLALGLVKSFACQPQSKTK